MLFQAEAANLLPQLIEKTAGRKEVKDALAKAISNDVGEDADEGNDDDTTMDLFAHLTPVSNPDTLAIETLRAIRAIPPSKDLFKQMDDGP